MFDNVEVIKGQQKVLNIAGIAAFIFLGSEASDARSFGSIQNLHLENGALHIG